MTKLIYPQPFWRGFNMTGVCGAFGAAVGCSKLLNFNEDQMANAVGICGLYSPISSRESFYHEIKPTHAGRASEAGLLSVLITERGIQASKEVLETPGYGGVCSRMIAECKDFSQITESLGSHFELEEVYFKPYPSCRHTHGSIQAILELLREQRIDPDNVTKVNVATYDVAKNAVGDRRPASKSIYCTRQFSIPYVVSASLINQKFEVEEIFGGASLDLKIYELMSKIEVSEDPKLTKRYPDTTPSNVEITLKNDRRRSKLIELPKGDPRNPMRKIDLEMKFRKLVVPKVGEKETVKLLFDLSNLEGIRHVSRLIHRLCATPDYNADHT
jgi:2-methylcitrate dehydratase PrpD